MFYLELFNHLGGHFGLRGKDVVGLVWIGKQVVQLKGAQWQQRGSVAEVEELPLAIANSSHVKVNHIALKLDKGFKIDNLTRYVKDVQLLINLSIINIKLEDVIGKRLANSISSIEDNIILECIQKLEHRV